MNGKPRQFGHRVVSRGAILLIWMGCLSAWGREVATPVTPNQADSNTADPSSFEKSHSNQMFQRVKSRLWQSRLDPLIDKPDADQAELRDLIKRLNAVRLSTPALKTKPKSSQKKASVISPSGVSSVQDSNRPTVHQPLMNQPTAPNEPKGPLSAATLQVIAQVQSANEPVQNPLELADLLYAHGYHTQAKFFYEQTLHQADPNGLLDKAWVLLQLGNCSKDKDLVEAKRYYSQVTKDDANSPWVAMAQTQLALVQLYIDSRPQELLRDSRKDPRKPATTSPGNG